MNLPLDDLRSRVFARQNILSEIYEQWGSLPLSEYVRSWRLGTGENLPVFARHLKLAAQKIYGNRISEIVAREFVANPLVSTIDHHGILNHPFFINSNLIYSLKRPKYLVCLPTAGVSLNNTTSWSGCLLATKPEGAMGRFSFFTDKHKTQAVLATAGFNEADAERVKFLIRNSNYFTDEEKNRLGILVQDISSPEILQWKDFSSQAALASTHIWNAVFPSAPRLLYIPLEELVSSIILEEIIPDPSHILHSLFFTEEGWNSIEKVYAGSLGAFTSAHKGSFLFWGVDEKGRRVHLHREGFKLVDHGFEINNIPEGMRNKKIYPSSLMCFLVLLYYDVTCLGGFNQVNWLTNIKEKFANLLRSVGKPERGEQVLQVVANNFAESSLAFGLRNGAVYKPTGIDLFLTGKDRLPAYRSLADTLTVGESIDIQLPEIYKVITPAAERDTRILSVTEEHILAHNGTKRKIMESLTGF